MELAVKTITFRVIEKGAEFKEETAIDISQRIKREEDEKRKKDRFINYPGDAQDKALIEYDGFLDMLKNEITTFNGTAGTIPIKSEYDQAYHPIAFRMVLYPLEVLIYYRYAATNVLEGSYIDYKIFNTKRAQPIVLKAEKFTYDYNERHEWRIRSN
jgi:hypothetical protein